MSILFTHRKAGNALQDISPAGISIGINLYFNFFICFIISILFKYIHSYSMNRKLEKLESDNLSKLINANINTHKILYITDIFEKQNTVKGNDNEKDFIF